MAPLQYPDSEQQQCRDNVRQHQTNGNTPSPPPPRPSSRQEALTHRVADVYPLTATTSTSLSAHLRVCMCVCVSLPVSLRLCLSIRLTLTHSLCLSIRLTLTHSHTHSVTAVAEDWWVMWQIVRMQHKATKTALARHSRFHPILVVSALFHPSVSPKPLLPSSPSLCQ